MQKLLLAGFVVFTFIIYSVHQRGEGHVSVVTPPSLATNTPSSTPTPLTAEGTPTPEPASTPTPIPTRTLYKDGSYTGSSANAVYGFIQVRATVSGGKITSVAFLQYPKDRSTSVRINSQAMPYLQQEAIQAQSANVDTISGATDTSQAFRQSLSDALNAARS